MWKQVVSQCCNNIRVNTLENIETGIKVHTAINADEKIPSLVCFSPVTRHNHNFLQQLKCDDKTIYVFDKEYNDYKAFKHFTDNKTGFVTRIKDNSVYEKLETKQVQEELERLTKLKLVEIAIGQAKSNAENIANTLEVKL